MRREKSLRIGVHHANAVVWEPVYRTHLIFSSSSTSTSSGVHANEHIRFLADVNGSTLSTTHASLRSCAYPRSRMSPVANCKSAVSVLLPRRSTLGRGSVVQSDVGVESTGVRWNGGEVERRRARCVGKIESVGCAERNGTPGEKVLKE